MDTQLVIVGIMVVVAGAYLLRSAWRTWVHRSSCGGGCGCGKTANGRDEAKAEVFIPVQHLTLRGRQDSMQGASVRAETVPTFLPPGG